MPSKGFQKGISLGFAHKAKATKAKLSEAAYIFLKYTRGFINILFLK